MTWTPAGGRRELGESDLPPILRIRCELLLLRMRIEHLANSLSDASLAQSTPTGHTVVRLWGLLSTVPPEGRPAAESRVRQVQQVYGLSSDYLHSRRAAVVPSSTELATWTASVNALEELLKT